MRKYKRPCELRTKVIRINLEDYQLLDEICRRHYVTMAEALHMLLRQQKPSPDLSVKLVPSMSVKPVQAVSLRSRVLVNQNGGVK